MPDCAIGLVGLAVMGQNLVRNIANHGFKVAVYNRTTATAQKFMDEHSKGAPIEMGVTLKDFVGLLKRPRNILIMVKAGKPVDAIIEQLLPLLEPGDLIADCGNSFYKDTERREKELSAKGFVYLGVGVSGGEEGALKGPSIMPGGSKQGYERVRKIFEAITAKVAEGPCVTYIGPGGAGHYVKMVHNGLEYGDMQLISETYDLLQTLGGFGAGELSAIFGKYNQGVLNSYLIEITETVLKEKDPDTGKHIVDIILDTAHQKGTGSWTSQDAFNMGEPIPTITQAVEARSLSAKKDERVAAEKIFGAAPKPARFPGDLVTAAGNALYAAKLALYGQGMSLLRKASIENHYDLKLPELARIWKGGCIIRAALLDVIRKTFSQTPDLANLLVAPEVAKAVKEREDDWRKIILAAVSAGIPAPAFCSALAYYDSYKRGRLPANLIQAQRDYFGAHTFERIDKPGEFHHLWPMDDSKK